MVEAQNLQNKVEMDPVLLGRVEEAVQKTLDEAGEGARTVSLAIVDDAAIHEMNRTYRHKDAPTDVLSFPLADGPEDPHLGDIAISAERALSQAESFGHPLTREMAFLAVHGTLHLLGYDHQTPEEEEEMTRRAEAVLTSLGITR